MQNYKCHSMNNFTHRLITLLKQINTNEQITTRFMSIKKTENFLYFQNKASHYNNITKVKSRLDVSKPRSFRKTIDYHDVKNVRKHEPHLRDYDIQSQNEGLMKRILQRKNVKNSLRSSPLNKEGEYARYHSFERSFRKLSPHRQEELRLIELQNRKLKRARENAKAEVGSIEQWKKEHSESTKHSRIMSRYSQLEEPSLKEGLIINTEKYIPERYLKYIEMVGKSEINDQQSMGSSSRVSRNTKALKKEKLFVLPHLNRLESPTHSEARKEAQDLDSKNDRVIKENQKGGATQNPEANTQNA